MERRHVVRRGGRGGVYPVGRHVVRGQRRASVEPRDGAHRGGERRRNRRPSRRGIEAATAARHVVDQPHPEQALDDARRRASIERGALGIFAGDPHAVACQRSNRRSQRGSRKPEPGAERARVDEAMERARSGVVEVLEELVQPRRARQPQDQREVDRRRRRRRADPPRRGLARPRAPGVGDQRHHPEPEHQQHGCDQDDSRSAGHDLRCSRPLDAVDDLIGERVQLALGPAPGRRREHRRRDRHVAVGGRFNG